MNKNHDDFYLNKTRTSELMKQKADVPTRLREALGIYGISEKTEEEMAVFIEDYLDTNRKEGLIQSVEDFIQSDPSVTDEEKNILHQKNGCASGFLSEALLMSLSENNRSEPHVLTIWKHGTNSVDVRSGDLFKYGFNNRGKKKNIVVIPVNTAFDTHVSRKLEGDPYPIVSENTLHGQWLVRLEESEGVDQLDDRIEESLKSHGFKPTSETGGSNGKQVCYSVGAIAVIETKKAVYFLIAISEFDDFNNARSSPEDINRAMVSLVNMYDRFGQGYDLYLPLMGTGRSRAGLSSQEAYDLLIDSLMANQANIHGRIHLILREEDREEIDFGKE